jgi:uncharacterized protein YdeI (YjbR/CyaY-like superfamily)
VQALYFESPAAWRRWLTAHHADTDELWVGFHKRATGKPSLTWPESVDEALCFGWIDGLRKRVDADRYQIRFTPRRPGSIWSAVNVRRVAELTKRKRMRAAGVRAFKARTAAKTAVYSFEQRKAAALPPAYAKTFKADADAWRFFTTQAPSYQRVATWWVISAKQEATQLRRLNILIADSARGRRLDPMKPGQPSDAKRSPTP